MKVQRLHSWKLTAAKAIEVQRRLQKKIVLRGTLDNVGLVAGADVSFLRDDPIGFAAVVVLTFPQLELVEIATASGPLEFPYIPGLLTFREGPLLVKAFRKIRSVPDVVLFDGHGIAHPRRFGLACHMGLVLDLPAIGCAKTILVGDYKQPGKQKGSYAALHHGYFTLGRVLRTRRSVKPIFVSPGHKISVPLATSFSLTCSPNHRIPEPTRLAHKTVNDFRKRTYS